MEDYQFWNREKEYGDVLHERATGKKEEMESSKALCKILSPFYRRRMKVLDVGCGPGHYLKSLRRLDENMDYTGMDITEYYIQMAKKAFDGIPFYLGDIYNIPFGDNSFDIVLCSNVLDARDGIKGHCLPKDIGLLNKHFPDNQIFKAAVNINKRYIERKEEKK